MLTNKSFPNCRLIQSRVPNTRTHKNTHNCSVCALQKQQQLQLRQHHSCSSSSWRQYFPNICVAVFPKVRRPVCDRTASGDERTNTHTRTTHKRSRKNRIVHFLLQCRGSSSTHCIRRTTNRPTGRTKTLAFAN